MVRVEKIEQNLGYRLKDEDILYFLHIPKTAGTTLITILDNQFDFDSIYQKHDWEQVLPNLPKDFSKCKLIRGHFGYGVYRILPRKPVYITFLRDPVEQTISDYEQSVRVPYVKNETIRQTFQNVNLAEIINDPNKKWRFTNNQTRWIALDLDPLSLTNSLDPISIEGFARLILPEFRSSSFPDDKSLEIAKQRLSEFAFVGLTERFEDSLYLLCYTFGWRPIQNVLKQNVAPDRMHRDDLSKETIDAIKKCTKQDTELYNYAQQLFEDRFSQMVKELKEKYYEPRFANMPFHEMMYELLEKHYEQRFGELEKVHFIEYNFRKKMYGSGWYAREFLSDGTVFRWTGPDTVSTIDFPLARNDYRIQFCVVMCLASDIQDSLQFRVNETPIDLKVLQQEGKTVFEGMIPKSALDSEKKFTRLTFQVNRTINPKSINPDSSDTRMLGLAFEWIKIAPYNESKDRIIIK